MASDFPPDSSDPSLGRESDRAAARKNHPVMAQAVPGNDYEEVEYAPPTSSGKGCKWLAIGCFVTALVLLLVASVASFWIYKNSSRLIADGAVTVGEQMVNEMDLPPEQSDQIVDRIKGLGEQYKEGKITLEDLVEVGEELSKDEDVIMSGIVYFVDSQVLEEAPIDDDLRAEVRRMTHRLARGVIEDQIELDDLKPLMDGIVKKTADGYELDPDVSQEDFENVLESAKTIADQAEIPDEPYEVDFMKEVDEVIDSVLEK